MATLLEYVGNVHIYLGPYRGNPIALYLKRNGDQCVISPKVYPWNGVVGVGETPNKAAADFEDKWKAKGLSPEMYTGPSWEGGIKPDRPKPAPPPAGGSSPPPRSPERQASGAEGQGGTPPATHSNQTAPSDAAARPAADGSSERHPQPEASASTTPPNGQSHSSEQH